MNEGCPTQCDRDLPAGHDQPREADVATEHQVAGTAVNKNRCQDTDSGGGPRLQRRQQRADNYSKDRGQQEVRNGPRPNQPIASQEVFEGDRVNENTRLTFIAPAAQWCGEFVRLLPLQFGVGSAADEYVEVAKIVGVLD